MALPLDDWGPPQPIDIWGGPGEGGGGGSPGALPSLPGPGSGMARGFTGLPASGFAPMAFRRRLGNWGKAGQAQAAPSPQRGAQPMTGRWMNPSFGGSSGGQWQGWNPGGNIGGMLGNINNGLPVGTQGGAQGGVSYNWGVLNDAIQRANQAGLFGINPPEGIMAALRQRGAMDLGARQRGAEYALQGDSSIDPSSYGFLRAQGQQRAGLENQNFMSQADFALRQQQMQFLQDLLRQAIGGQQQNQAAQAAGNQGFDFGGFASGIGSLIGGFGGGRR